MKKTNRILAVFTAVLVLAFVGCGSESSMNNNTTRPSATVGESTVKRPYVTGLSEINDTSIPAVTGYDNKRLTIGFSADLDPATVTSANIYMRDVTGTTAISPITSTVTYDPVSRNAYVYYTISNTTPPIREVVVSRNVTDINGTGLAGLHGYTAAYETVNADFKRCSSGPTNNYYLPLYVVSLTAVHTGPTTATVNLTLSRSVTKASFLSSSITISGGVKGAETYTPAAGTTATQISIPVTGLSANSVYTVTFNPAGVTIDPASNLYPDGTTSVFTSTGVNFMDAHTYDMFGDKRISDFITKFATVNSTAVVTVNPITFGTKTITVTFSAAIDPTTVVASNFVAYGYDGISLYYPVQIKVKPIYTGTAVLQVQVSTAELGGEIIQRLMIKNSVKSAGGDPIDGNGDGSLLGTVDITGDNVVDDDNYRSW